MRARAALVIALLVVSATARAGGPSAETTRRLGSGLESLAAGSFSGSFTVTAASTVAKPNGGDREESLEVIDVVQEPGKEPSRQVVKIVENGQDVTEKRLREAERAEAKKRKQSNDSNEESGVSMQLRLPSGEDAALYEFGPAKEEGELIVAAFAPLPEHRDDDGMAEGRLAWSPQTLDPAWMELRPVTMPSHVSEMAVRFEFSRSGEVLYVRRTVTDGTGGMLWIKRRFHVETEISNVLPASGSQATPGE